MSGHSPFDHVKDGSFYELPNFLLDLIGGHDSAVLPAIDLFGCKFQITKFMVAVTASALLTIWVAFGLASRVRGGKVVTGYWWNFVETLVVFIRDQVVRTSIGRPHHLDPHYHGHSDHSHGDHSHSDHSHGDHGHGDHLHGERVVEVGHPADHFLPYVLTVFFFILFCNLLGAMPFLGAPTANTSVTGVLALVTLFHTIKFGSEPHGFGGFLKSIVPPMEVPFGLGYVLVPMLWAIEALGLLIKHAVLAIRLFANIMAGHTVVATFLLFIHAGISQGVLWYAVTAGSVGAQVAIGVLELGVAFLQAYVFSLLTSLFISMAVNPH